MDASIKIASDSKVKIMSKFKVKVLKTGMVTHNVKRFVVQRPMGYNFISGQATDVSLNKPGMEEELRPFTFTSISDLDYLEFMIKIYPGHNGVTKNLGDVEAGDELILHDVFGTIAYRGPGLFIAGGTGITPFISIFRDLKSKGTLEGNTLIFVNRTVADVILKEELEEMLSENFIKVIETSSDPTLIPRTLNRKLLETYVNDKNQFYYVCGPDSFTLAMVEHLVELGVDKRQIITEQ